MILLIDQILGLEISGGRNLGLTGKVSFSFLVVSIEILSFSFASLISEELSPFSENDNFNFN